MSSLIPSHSPKFHLSYLHHLLISYWEVLTKLRGSSFVCQGVKYFFVCNCKHPQLLAHYLAQECAQYKMLNEWMDDK